MEDAERVRAVCSVIHTALDCTGDQSMVAPNDTAYKRMMS